MDRRRPLVTSTGPQRTCIGCSTVRPARSLVRLVLEPDGRVVIGRRAPGRGAWLCPDESCLERARRRRSFTRAFRRPVDDGQLAGLVRSWPAVVATSPCPGES